MFKKWANQMILFGSLAVCQAAVAAELPPTEIEYQYAEESGGKGKDSIKLTAPKACAVFDDARIVYKKRRYGQADIITKPNAGCDPDKAQCKLEVAWEHAPAGRLNYQVEVSWRLASGC